MPKLLLCPPDFYGIEYEINPWMRRSRAALPAEAQAQWQGLRNTLISLGCEVELIPPQPKLPDMVFTANAGLVAGNQFIGSRFRFPERRGEERHFEAWFAARGYEIVRPPDDLYFEGEGDALFSGDLLFCGYHFRSDIQSHEFVGEILRRLVISVELVDDRFYHLDTCFCPLADGSAMWYPAAFDEYGRRAIRQHLRRLIDVSAAEAAAFACNAVVLGRDVVLPAGCPKLSAALEAEGYRPHSLQMTEFLKAGGACKCLTLFLPQAL